MAAGIASLPAFSNRKVHGRTRQERKPESEPSLSLEKGQGATRLGATGLRASEREICLWKGLCSEKSLKISENTSRNLWKPSLSETLSEADFPLRGSRSCCPYYLPLKLSPISVEALLKYWETFETFLQRNPSGPKTGNARTVPRTKRNRTEPCPHVRPVGGLQDHFCWQSPKHFIWRGISSHKLFGVIPEHLTLTRPWCFCPQIVYGTFLAWITFIGNEQCAQTLFSHKLFEHPRGSGTSRQIWEGDEDSNFSIFRIRRFSEWPEPLHWIAFPVEILTKPLIHWIASPLFTENPFFSLKSASLHPLPRNRLWSRARCSPEPPPLPPGGLQTQEVNLCALFSCLILAAGIFWIRRQYRPKFRGGQTRNN